MKTKIFDYRECKEDIFYKVIYPIFAKEFLFGGSYVDFALLVQTKFLLNSQQWELILKYWEEKESILS